MGTFAICRAFVALSRWVHVVRRVLFCVELLRTPTREANEEVSFAALSRSTNQK